MSYCRLTYCTAHYISDSIYKIISLKVKLSYNLHYTDKMAFCEINNLIYM
ncbi:hypothetical protein FM106_16810 [Brachybacterium faecium]|nr:hypothetical protein FM106_16810 [Brachybacterium faecium]